MNSIAGKLDAGFDLLLQEGVNWLNAFKNDVLTHEVFIGIDGFASLRIQAWVGDLQVSNLDNQLLEVKSMDVQQDNSRNDVRVAADFGNLLASFDEIGLAFILEANGGTSNCLLGFNPAITLPQMQFGVDFNVAGQTIKARPSPAVVMQGFALDLKPLYEQDDNQCAAINRDIIVPAFALLTETLLNMALQYTSNAFSEALDTLVGTVSLELPEIDPVSILETVAGQDVLDGNIVFQPEVLQFYAPDPQRHPGSVTSAGGSRVTARMTSGPLEGSFFEPYATLSANMVQTPPTNDNGVVAVHLFSYQINRFLASAYYLLWNQLVQQSMESTAADIAANAAQMEQMCAFAAVPGSKTNQDCPLPPMTYTAGFGSETFWAMQSAFMWEGLSTAYYTGVSVGPPRIEFNAERNSVEGVVETEVRVDRGGACCFTSEIARLFLPVRVGATIPTYDAATGKLRDDMRVYLELSDDWRIEVGDLGVAENILDQARSYVNKALVQLLPGVNTGLNDLLRAAPAMVLAPLNNFPVPGATTKLELNTFDVTAFSDAAVEGGDKVKAGYLSIVGDVDVQIDPPSADFKNKQPSPPEKDLNQVIQAVDATAKTWTKESPGSVVQVFTSTSTQGSRRLSYRTEDDVFQEKQLDGSWRRI